MHCFYFLQWKQIGWVIEASNVTLKSVTVSGASSTGLYNQINKPNKKKPE
jgi:hypothetical protein